jgi:hypothetical protein|tara:strand:- start:178 stop:477 length:300 start_codon:yes stop_codon:yes gene_type:complete
MISIKYNELVNKYNEILISTSRGFDTKHEFLESWVPNLDLTQSVSDLFNSAIDYSLNELEIIFSESEIKELDLNALKKKFVNQASIDLKSHKLTFTKNK